MNHMVNSLVVSSDRCLGCLRFDSDIMVSLGVDNNFECEDKKEQVIHDFFLTTGQAEDLIKKLTSNLERNAARKGN